MKNRTINKENLDKIIKFIELSEKEKEKNNKERLDENRNDQSQKGNG
jgi:hypothetical protein